MAKPKSKLWKNEEINVWYYWLLDWEPQQQFPVNKFFQILRHGITTSERCASMAESKSFESKFGMSLTRKNCEFIKYDYLFENCSLASLQGIRQKGLIWEDYSTSSSFGFDLGFAHKWRHGLREEGHQGFCDDSTKPLLIKSMTMGEGVS